MKELFSHAATVLPVRSVPVSIDFYENKLGFSLTFTWNTPATYAVLKRGDVSIHLTTRQDQLKPSLVHNTLYIFVHDIDKVYEEFINREITISNPIGNRDYKMRDFDIIDPDGYTITFGMATPERQE